MKSKFGAHVLLKESSITLSGYVETSPHQSGLFILDLEGDSHILLGVSYLLIRFCTLLLLRLGDIQHLITASVQPRLCVLQHLNL